MRPTGVFQELHFAIFRGKVREGNEPTDSLLQFLSLDVRRSIVLRSAGAQQNTQSNAQQTARLRSQPRSFRAGHGG